jgi:ribosomal protein S18 acetylase RimI-like enzyme
MQIRLARHDDRDAIWRILQPTIRAGETYALPTDMSEADALAYWTGPDREVFVAEGDGVILGVANCGYVTAPEATGRGVARRMCEHSLQQARDRGFRAMQFNFVVATNERAIGLWQSLGFETVGRLPLAFLHPRFGYTDALVMFRAL